MLLAVLGGCMTTDKPTPGQPREFGAVSRAREVPGAQGPFGQPVPVYTADKGKSPYGIVQSTRRRSLSYSSASGFPAIPEPYAAAGHRPTTYSSGAKPCRRVFSVTTLGSRNCSSTQPRMMTVPMRKQRR